MAITTRYFGDRSSVTTGSISIVFEADDDTMTRASGSFITDGFQVGDTVTVSGTTNNNGDKVITDVAALVLTSSTALTDETDASTTIVVKTGDGTSWDKRAQLFDSSNTWSSIIDDFDFTSNSLLCYIGPGTYTCGEALTTSVSTPTAANPLILHGCDSSGNALTPPDPDWVSAQPPWSDDTLPVISTTTDIATINLYGVVVRLLKFTASGRTGGEILKSSLASGPYVIVAEWCHIVNSANNSSARCAENICCNSCVLNISGTSFNAAFYLTAQDVFLDNCRLIGNGSSSSGDRYGIRYTTGTSIFRCTLSGFVGGAIFPNTANVNYRANVVNCTIVNKAGVGVSSPDTATLFSNTVLSCYIADCTTGIDANQGYVLAMSNRVAGNTNNFVDFKNRPDSYNDSTTWAETELVSYSSASPAPTTDDYRISIKSAFWGKGYGAGDEILRNRPKASLVTVGA